MQLLAYDDLTPEMLATQALTHASAFGDPWPPQTVRAWREGGLLADYVGIFAVEGGEVLGQTVVLRLPFRTPKGPIMMGGIAAVVTRPDRTGRGIAGRVLGEVHARERAAGSEATALWTNRSWGAHRLYEKIGYRDIYAPPSVARWVHRRRPRAGTRRPRGGVATRSARRSDVRGIEALHDRVLGDRPGFGIRPRGALRIDVEAMGRKVLEPVWVAHRGGRLVGYAYLERSDGRARCSEMVASDPMATVALRRRLEEMARGRWEMYDMSVVQELSPWPSGQGYARMDGAWYVLMGCDLSGRTPANELSSYFGSGSAGFACMRGDRF